VSYAWRWPEMDDSAALASITWRRAAPTQPRRRTARIMRAGAIAAARPAKPRARREAAATASTWMRRTPRLTARRGPALDRRRPRAGAQNSGSGGELCAAPPSRRCTSPTRRQRRAARLEQERVASGGALFLSIGAPHIVAQDSIPVLLGTCLGGSHHCESNHEDNGTSDSNEHNRRDYNQTLH
jgi:hypothetical protein